MEDDRFGLWLLRWDASNMGEPKLICHLMVDFGSWENNIWDIPLLTETTTHDRDKDTKIILRRAHTHTHVFVILNMCVTTFLGSSRIVSGSISGQFLFSATFNAVQKSLPF